MQPINFVCMDSGIKCEVVLSMEDKTILFLKNTCRIFLYFIDRASRYKFLLITNLKHFFIYLFISSLYMFRAS